VIKFSICPPDTDLPPCVTIQVSGPTDINRLRRTLNRALNCDPEAGADLFKLSDDLDSFLRVFEEGAACSGT
jgi:hypothetical protein